MKRIYKRRAKQFRRYSVSELPLVKISVQKRIMADQLVCSTVYGLNKSFSKKTLVGIDVSSKGELEIVIRLIANDYSGIRFTPVQWKHFTDTIEEIDNYFQTYDKTGVDSKIIGPGFVIRFTISYGDKAIEIEENQEQESACPTIKKYKKSFVIKQATFEGLKSSLRCIRAKMENCGRMIEFADNVVRELGKIIREKFESVEESQVIVLSTWDVRRYSDKIEQKDVERITSILQGKLMNVSIEEISVLVEEFLNFKTDFVAHFTNPSG